MKRMMAWVLAVGIGVGLWMGVCLAPAALAGSTYEAKTYDLGGPLDRVKLRAKASTDGKVLGQYFSGVLVTVLQSGGTWSHVRIGNREGYMMSRFLTTEISDDNREYEGVPGAVHYAGESGLALRAEPDASAPVLAMMPQGYVRVLGTVGENWLHVCYIDHARQPAAFYYGYADSYEITQTENFARFTVDTGDPAQKLNLRGKPSTSAKVLGQYFSGTEVYAMFDDHTNGDGWQRVRAGEAVGYMQERYLDGSTGGMFSYAPPLSLAKRDGVPLYMTAEGTATIGSIDPKDAFFVMGEREGRYYVGVETGEPYAYAYGYVEKADVQPVGRAAKRKVAITAGAEMYWLDEEQGLRPVDAEFAVQPGAVAWVYGSASQDGSVRTAGYVDRRMPWAICEVEYKPAHVISGVMVALGAVDVDEGLIYKEGQR